MDLSIFWTWFFYSYFLWVSRCFITFGAYLEQIHFFFWKPSHRKTCIIFSQFWSRKFFLISWLIPSHILIWYYLVHFKNKISITYFIQYFDIWLLLKRFRLDYLNINPHKWKISYQRHWRVYQLQDNPIWNRMS